MDINVRADVKQATKQLNRIQRQQVPFATALALTKTAQAAQKETTAEMPRVFDRPTRFTLNSVFVSPAKKRKLVAIVGLKDFIPKGTPAGVYLLPQIFGGPRRHKRFERALIRAGIMRPDEYAIPGKGERLNSFGNMTKGRITKILSNVMANPDPLSNITGSRRSRARRAGETFFYRRTFRGILVRRGNQIRPALVFVRQPRYKRRFRFPEIVERTVRFRFPREFQRALRRALRTAS